MKKQANWPGTLLGSAAVGGGTFALGQLIQEVMHQKALEEKARQRREAPENSLVIDLPSGLQPKAAEVSPTLPSQFLKEAGELLSNSLALLAGAPLGFMGTKALYDKWKKQQMDEEIAASNRKYLQALQQVGKMAEETPVLDAFCAGVADNMEKAAVDLKGVYNVAKTWVKNNPAKIVGGTALPFMGYAGYRDLLSNAPEQPNMVTKTLEGGKDAFKILAALTALTTGGMMINAARNKEEKSKPALPSSVALNYKNISDPSAVPQAEDYANPVVG